MHNIKFIRKEPDLFLKKIKQRNADLDLTAFLDLDKKNRELIQKKEKLEQEKKSISKKKDKSQFSRSKEISAEIVDIEKSPPQNLPVRSMFLSIMIIIPLI